MGSNIPPPPDARRIEMPDGRWWSIVRRHEMARIRTRRDTSERRLYLLFVADGGEFRRLEVAPDSPDPASLTDEELVEAWRAAASPG